MTSHYDIKQWIEGSLPGSKAEVFGDGRHFEARVIAQQFAGKNLLERHRIVYEALGDRMKSQIHALSLKTLTPEENL